MLLNVNPLNNLLEKAYIPSSKPETQRAILAATLAQGKSVVRNDLRCLETTTMKEACRAIGAVITEQDGYLEIEGVGRNLRSNKRVIDALGSGLVFRVFSAITSFSNTPEIITGDKILRGRVMAPLFDALDQLGAKVSHIAEQGQAPVVNWGGGFEGGRCVIPGNVSSQFITAIMFAAPLAAKPTEIEIVGEILSISYIKQTIQALEIAGIQVECSDNFSVITVYPGEYQPAEYAISGDYTSSSYVIGAAALYPGKTILQNMSLVSLQGEKAILDVVEKLGIEISFDEQLQELTLINNQGTLSGEFEFDASDYPNIVPTLAAIGAYVEGTFRVIGGSITRLHKSPRIKAMVSELQKMGVDIQPLFKDGVYDGFEIHGKAQYEGGLELSSWGDHRIFMSLFIASLRCKTANQLEGYADVICSFPDFFTEFERLGAKFTETNGQGEVKKEA
ncbi:3-phosphoshikimate 1-carboxyvinyltransferase [Pseudoalteromonas umbrosa]|uniref:3-phosphoshikimate 1-carboxyvinyltransferase n=1 Tax=Pseudoalteromonas umbrosa TaxID=3048489 RepID=UPI0024C25E04|nr:3-phosphoshikimate 1-carboxyvinyltransferase [Pseudoalteromonas sp. B95]MDK1290626.1 3-phosphoshikimate 1-carboxyvinyltransferase [Pseudoalteromonas sp. B95]